MRPCELRCEYVDNPIGVQTVRPLLSWAFGQGAADAYGQRQLAYRVVAASSSEKLLQEDYDEWDSGRINSDRHFGIEYQGLPLGSGKRVYWRVKLWGLDSLESAWSDCAFFEMGLLQESDWQGRWMGFLGGLIGNGILMRYSFKIEKPVIRARAYIAGLGYYELSLNGQKVGDKLLDPGATDTSKTILYSSYDITGLLRDGLNAVGIMLGTGWTGMPKVLLQVNIEFDDGSTRSVCTDWGIGWCVAKGPLVYNSIYDGEDYDARLEKDNWTTPEYEDQFEAEHQRPGGWILATIIEPPGGRLTGDIMPPIRVTDQYEPKLVETKPDGSSLYDIGRNISGWVAFKVKGKRGSRVTLTFAESLTADGDLDRTALRLARSQDNYILRGDLDLETYCPRFTYHGFRYFTVKLEGEAEILELSAQFVRSDLKDNVSFESDDESLNRLAEVMKHTDACNIHSIPTDCCQRDERHGWTTDTTSRLEGIIYHFDAASFFAKWTRDVFDTQDEKGYFADTAPHRWGRRPCDPQVNTPICLPLYQYNFFGNKRVLSQTYSSLQKYIGLLLQEADEYLVSRTGFGEWACPKDECYPEPNGAGAVSKNVSATLVSTVYLYKSICEMQQIAGILGYYDDADWYKSIADVIYIKFNSRFLNRSDGYYDANSQSSNALALKYGLVPEEYQKQVVEHIVSDIVSRDYHLSTGNMGTKAVIEVLADNNKNDLIHKVFSNETSPGFGYMLAQGATTIWERWEADNNNEVMNSRNHPMLSSCNVWFYKYLAGISLDQQAVGADSLIINPKIPADVNMARFSMHIMAGDITGQWQKADGKFSLNIAIPVNTTAKIIIDKDYAKGSSDLYINGKKASDGPFTDGVCAITESIQAYAVQTGSGYYEFRLQ